MQTHSFSSIILRHQSRYPLMQPADLYKLAHQAALGSEHAVPNPEKARAWLDRELAEMGSGPSEPLLDAISGDGRVLRVHLRPCVQAGYPVEALLKAFLDTANRFEPDYSRLRQYLNAVLTAAQSGAVGIPVDGLISYFDRMAASDWPAVHHSSEYQEAYRPAYRVVARECLPERLRA